MSFRVIDPGHWTTVQDHGRTGWREWGVPQGGAADRGSAALANALLGNEPDCALLEMTLRGGVYEALVPLGLCLAGAPMEASIVDSDGGQRPLRSPQSFPILPGERLVMGPAIEGARAYLAVVGGWLTPVRLGSRSAEEPLRAGLVLPARGAAVPVRRLAEAGWEPAAADPLRIVDGLDTHGLIDPEDWHDRRFRVGSRSDRMGLRLEGEPPASSRVPADRLSAPVAPGTIQLAGGTLLVLGVACGTMGGYPHVAQVVTADLDRLGQLRPGDRLGFLRITMEEARQLDRRSRAAHRIRMARLVTLAGGRLASPG